MTQSSFAILSSLALAAMIPLQASADTAVNMQVHSSLPVSCHADVISPVAEFTATSVKITATVQQSCNTRHDLAVTFGAATGISTAKLNVTLDSVQPTVRTATSHIFTNLAHTETVQTQALIISYAAGTAAQRQQLAATWGLTISPR